MARHARESHPERSRRWARCLPAAIAITAGATACSTTPDARPTPPSAPADAYVELVLGTSREQGIQRQMAVEEAVAACMAEQGFEYIPDVSHYTFPDEATMDPPRDSRKFAELYGYGIIEAPPTSGPPPGANPNDTITASLGPEALARYMEALAGPSSEDTDAEYDWQDAGCLGAATHAEWSTGAAQDPAAVALQAEIARINDVAIPADQRVVALDEAWSACMADAGYDGLRRQPDAAGRAFESWMDAQAASASGETEETDADDVAAAERSLAVADWDCREDVGYDLGVAKVREELQEAYVAAHRAELDSWVEKWADGASPSP